MYIRLIGPPPVGSSVLRHQREIRRRGSIWLLLPREAILSATGNHSPNRSKRMYRSSHWPVSSPIPVTFALLLLTACETTDREPSLTELRASRQELRLQFTSLNSQIRPAEMQALDSPNVQLVQAEFRTALETKMVELDPEAASWFREAARLGELLQSAPTDTTLTFEQKRGLAEDLQRLERTMGPIQTQAMQDSVVAEHFRMLQDTLMETVMRIDPSMRPVLADMRELESQILALDQKIARRSGSAPGSEAPTP